MALILSLVCSAATLTRRMQTTPASLPALEVPAFGPGGASRINTMFQINTFRFKDRPRNSFLAETYQFDPS